MHRGTDPNENLESESEKQPSYSSCLLLVIQAFVFFLSWRMGEELQCKHDPPPLKQNIRSITCLLNSDSKKDGKQIFRFYLVCCVANCPSIERIPFFKTKERAGVPRSAAMAEDKLPGVREIQRCFLELRYKEMSYSLLDDSCNPLK